MDGSSPIPASGAAGGALAPAPNPQQGMNDASGALVAEMNQNDAQSKALIAREQTDMAPSLTGANRALSQPTPGVPNFKSMQAAPNNSAEQSKNADDFLKWATVLAGIAGAFSKQHITTSLNALGGSLKGFHEGQLEQGAQLHQEWKDATEAAIENNKAMQQQYQDAVNNRKMSIDEQMAKVQLVATMYHDPIMYQMSEAKNFMGVSKLIDAQRDAGDKLKLGYDRMEAVYGNVKEVSTNAVESVGFDPMTPEGQAAMAKMPPKALDKFMKVYKFVHPDAGMQLDEIGLDYAADLLRKTGQIPLGYGAPAMKAKVLERAAQKNQSEGGGDPGDAGMRADYKSNQMALGQVTKTAAMIDSYSETVEKVGGLIRRNASKGIGPTGMPVFDQWVQAGRKATGDADVKVFANSIDTYTSEYGRIMGGGYGAAQTTDAATLKAQRQINEADNIESLTRALDQMDMEMDYRKNGLNDQKVKLQKAIREGGKSVQPPVDGSDGVIKYDQQGNRQ